MANIGSFNPQAQEPLGDFTPIPKGEWNCIITDSTVDQSNPNDPKLVMDFEVCEGTAKGGKFQVHFWLWAPSENNGKGKGDISRRKLTSITNALGIYQQFEDTAILHGKPLTVKTDIRWKPKNDNPSEMIGFPDPKSFNPYKGPQAAGADPVQPTAPAAPAQAVGAPGLRLPGAPGMQTGFSQQPAFQGAPALPQAPVATQQPAPQFQTPAPGTAPGFPPAGPAGTAPAFGQQPQFQAPPQGFPPQQQPAPQQFAPPQAPGFPPVPGAPGPWAGPR